MPRFLCFVPLFRLRHPSVGHFYTIDIVERDRVITMGYISEGVACYVLDATGMESLLALLPKDVVESIDCNDRPSQEWQSIGLLDKC